MGEIWAAIERLGERKKAAGIEAKRYGKVASEETSRQIFSGFDLDMDEVYEVHQKMQRTALGGMLEGVPGPAIAGGMWFDGFVAGLMVAEARRRAEARS